MLNRVTLIRILDESKYEDVFVTLNKLKNMLLTSLVDYDEDFVKEGRRTELSNEFYYNINKEPLTDSNITSALNALKDYIHGQSWIEMDAKVEVKNYEQVYYKKYKELVSKNERYKEKGIISKEEKDILVDMIDTFLSKVSE